MFHATTPRLCTTLLPTTDHSRGERLKQRRYDVRHHVSRNDATNMYDLITYNLLLAGRSPHATTLRFNGACFTQRRHDCVRPYYLQLTTRGEIASYQNTTRLNYL